MSQAVEYKHITHREDTGEPVVAGTRTSVRAIVENRRLGLTPEEIPIHLPHLTLAQVYAALAYYSDHQEEVNEYIARNWIPERLIGTRVSGEELAKAHREGRFPKGTPLKPEDAST